MIAVVLGIWGTIGYKIINGLSPKDAISIDGDFEVSFSPKKTWDLSKLKSNQTHTLAANTGCTKIGSASKFIVRKEIAR